MTVIMTQIYESSMLSFSANHYYEKFAEKKIMQKKISKRMMHVSPFDDVKCMNHTQTISKLEIRMQV